MDAEVIIIGAGPVGLTLAAELSYRKVKCILVEKKDSTTTLPKAFNVTVRTMEHYRRLGLSEAIRKVSYPRDNPISMSVYPSLKSFTPYFNKTFSSWGEIADKEPCTEWLYFQSGCSVEIPMFCPQYQLEAVLKASVDSSPYVTVYWGCELLSFDQNANSAEQGVTVQIQPSDDNGSSDHSIKTLTARYLVGCDGGRSPIRKALGIPLYGKFNIQHVLGVYFDCPEIVDLVKPKSGLCVVIGNLSAFVVAFHPDKSRYFMQVFLTGDHSHHVKKLMDNPEEIVCKVVGKKVEVKIIACYPWNAHALLGGSYREGNVLLCGDAAHQWIPAGGLGMNTGLSDAADLAWKLEGALRGWGGPHLLDSYHLERYPIAENTVRYITHFFVGTRGILLLPSAVRLFILRLFGRFVGRMIGANMVQSMQEMTRVVLAFQYTNSNIVVHHPPDEVEDLPKQFLQDPFAPIALPGRRLPHIELPEVESLYDLVGERFVILVVNGEKEECASLQQAAAQRGMQLDVVVLPPLSQVVIIFNKRYYLIRPDTIIAWSSDFQPNTAEAEEIIKIVAGGYPSARIAPEIVTEEMWVPPRRVPLVFSASVAAAVAFGSQQYFGAPVAVSLLTGITILGLLHGWSNGPRGSALVKSVSRHKAAVLTKYGQPSEVLHITKRQSTSFGPKDVLIRVRAASVNPLDLRMCQGYSSSTFARMYKKLGQPEFPRPLGRDCAGDVITSGDEAMNFLPGDKVYAAVSPAYRGSHSQFVVVPESGVAFMPKNADFAGAASLPWVACTVWTALVGKAGLNAKNASGKKVLVHGGSGGVGTFAIQLLKAWGAEVATTCSGNNRDFVRHLGADTIVDYTSENFVAALPHDFDVVLDTVGFPKDYERPSLDVLKRFGGGFYVSLVSPSGLYTSALGSFFGGIVFWWMYQLKIFVNRFFYGRGFAYSACDPSKECLDAVRQLVEKGRIRPTIAGIYSLENTKEAFDMVDNGKPQGKVVIEID